jgi:ribonucleotide monophosphatase NagD (HAD superfamily)
VVCEANLCKPDVEMLETVLGMPSLPASRCLLIGNRHSTDIAMAVAAGIDSALVLTGETTPAMAAELSPDVAPTWILDRIDHLLPPEGGEGDG